MRRWAEAWALPSFAAEFSTHLNTFVFPVAIGNDILLIVFMDGNEAYDPRTVRSHYNHVVCVVQVWQYAWWCSMPPLQRLC